MNARVSICTSVLNQSDFLKRMIESVRAQTFHAWELIVVDDGSTEDIKGLVEGFHDSRIIYVRFPENRGIPHGLNYAFTLATGDYLQPLSADEWISPDKLAVQVEYLDNHPNIGCVWGLPGKGEMGERPGWEQYHLKAHNRSRQAWIRTLLRLEQIPIGGASLLMRREIMQELGGFDPAFFHCSDLELFVRFFQKHEGRVLCYRWADADQPDNRLTAPSEDNTRRFQQDMQKLHEKHGIVLPPMTGRVTIGIPVYNMARYIGKALDSLMRQTFQDFDIIVLDDASTDELLPALAPYGDRINLVKFEENQGVHKAVNAMIALTETEFFVSLAADDWLEPTYLERCLAEFRADPFLEFVASQTDFYDEKEQLIPDGKHPIQGIPKIVNRPREMQLQALSYGNQYFGAGMYRTYAIKDVGGLNVSDGVLCDYDVYLKLLQRENIKIIEEPLTHTRIHDAQASVGQGKFTAQWLRDKYHEIKSRYYTPRPKVIIATPFYEMKAFSPYVASLQMTVQMLVRLGYDYEWWELSGDSYVDRAKNTLFTKFLEDPAATDLFMIDSDMQWNPQGFLTMLNLSEGVVMGTYPQKNIWEKYTAIPEMVEQDGKFHPIGRPLGNEEALIKAAYLAGGFLRIKRAVLEAYKEKYEEQYHYYDQGADPSAPERKYIEFFTCERGKMVEDGPVLRWGEDRVFGKRLAAIGIDFWIYPNVDLTHFGIKGWSGNYHKHLRQAAMELKQ